MSNRLRSRDALRNSSNKCYAMFFEEEASSASDSRGVRTRSSPKKRESPQKKKSAVAAATTMTTMTTTTTTTAAPPPPPPSDDAEESFSREESVEKHVRFVKSESSESEAESGKRKFFASQDSSETPSQTSAEVQATKKLKTSSSSSSEKDQMFELFQPWALKTYGDQAKTKTITLRKMARILKALDGKEQNNPDSSKFRFWVKSKGFTTRTPECFASGRQATRQHEGTTAQRDNVDLYVASTTKDFGERTYRKVAIVEEFFNIIYSVHVELGGRSGRHAGQKRTYRIITETYAFLPREAVTKFLSGCPACKKNLRPFSPSRFEEQFTESSSEFEALNYSSHNESSVDSTHLEVLKPLKVKREESQLAKPNATELPKEVIKQEEDIKPEPSLKSEDATSKINEYWSKGNLIPSNLKGDDNILHYYHFLKKFCAYPSSVGWPHSEPNPIPNRKNLLEARRALSSSPNIGRTSPYTQNFHTKGVSNESDRQSIKNNESMESSIDLRIKPVDKTSSSININIENSITSTSSNSAPSKPQTPSSDSGISVDVSINMSNTLNELKISCKTTPPKKRYSVYRPDSAEESRRTEQKCAINLSKEFSRIEPESGAKNDIIAIADTTCVNSTGDQKKSQQVDLNKVKPITSTYLKMTRSMGLSDEDALKIDDLETLPTTGSDAIPDQAGDDSYAGLMKDADKLKLMLLAWNYQNSNAVRNGTDAPDLGVVGGLWAQYQNALALNTKQTSPVHRPEQSSPIENQDETNSSGQKDEDDGSEDDSDDKLDQNAQDPERLKAFNMFVRLFVDENLDRMIPISKQPKEKIQAIIDSCARQFPEFCERSRKRIRTYLKSCRRNKKAREGWDNTSRPTPAHLTSVQAEQILAIACENESMNAKRMRVGLDPISQAMPISSGAANPIETIAPSAPYPNFRTTPNATANSTAESDTTTPSTTAQTVSTARSSPLGLSTSGADVKPQLSVASNITTNSSQVSSPLYRPADFASPSSTTSPYTSRPQTYPPFFPNTSTSLATPTDLSMKQHSQQPSSQGLPTAGSSPTSRPPIVTHKLSANEITAARQVITAYRESAAFLLRTADQVEQLLLQQQ